MSKTDLMSELLDKYQQIESMDHDSAVYKIVLCYVRKLELKLKELL